MANPINPIANSINGVSQLDRMLESMSTTSTSGSDASQPQAADFQSMLVDVLGQANAADGKAQQAISDYQMESGISKPEVFIALRKAELALRTTMQIRNKLVEAYDEIQQMRI